MSFKSILDSSGVNEFLETFLNENLPPDELRKRDLFLRQLQTSYVLRVLNKFNDPASGAAIIGIAMAFKGIDLGKRCLKGAEKNG